MSGGVRCAVLFAALATSCTTSEADLVRSAMREFVRTPELAGGRVGVMVVDSANGAVLAENASDRGFATASNMKLIAGAVGLHTLGVDYVARTELVAQGDVHDGVLRGDLVLRGMGDPTLGESGVGEDALDALVAAVAAAGIRRVEGRVVGDGSWLGAEQRGLGWQWDYLSDAYAAPFGGLCMAGNTVTVAVAPGEREPVVSMAPAVAPRPRVAVTQGAAGSKTNVLTSRELGSDVIDVRGTIAADSRPVSGRVAVHDSARFAAAVMTQRLRQSGVEILGQTAATATKGPELLLGEAQSPPLRWIVGPLLTDSNNLYAEQVWRLAARHATGRGDTRSAQRHTAEFFRSIGIDPAGMVLADGSGLSRRNLVQPRQIAGLLLSARGMPWRDTFVAGLPIAGSTGTLLTRFTTGLARGRVRAKTGFISRVVCLSGYVPRPDPDDEPLVFCVMLNDFTCPTRDAKEAVDAFVEQLMVCAGWNTALATARP